MSSSRPIETPYGICTPRRPNGPRASKSSRPKRRLRIVLCLALLTLLALGAACAQAAITHPYTGTSFGPGGVGSGSFGNVVGVAVDQLSGDVLVLDSAEGGRIFKFDAAGEPADFSSTATNVIEGVGGAQGSEEEIAVDNSSGPDAGDIYVANNRVVKIYSKAGEPLGELSGGEMCGVAVDPSGNVYVGIYPETVRRYAPSTNPVTNEDEDGSMGGLAGICNVATDAAGDVYAATYNGGVDKYDALQFGSLAASGEAVDPAGRTLAVDPTSGEVFIDEVERIVQYEGSVQPPARVGTSGVGGDGALSGSFGVAVDHESGKLYAGDGSEVEIFGASAVVPDASTEAASGVTPTSATINGSVDPDGIAATYQFEYGTTTSYGSLTPATPAPAGSDSTAHHFEAHLSGLAPGATYHFRIIATNANGTTYGQDKALETSAPPTIITEGVARSTQHTARFEVGVGPHGLDTHYQIEYGTSAEYGLSTPLADLGSEGDVLYAYPEITGLALGTKYHFRVVASNAEGTVYGSDASFSTEAAVGITGEAALKVGPSSATLGASIDDYGYAATYHFDYGTTSAFGSATAPVTLAGIEGRAPVTAALSELTPATTYHFRLVAVSELGETLGPEATFTTEAVTAPALALPDGRGYEKVSPNANANGDVYDDVPLQLGTVAGYTEQPFIVAPSGNAVAYMGQPSEHGGTGAEGPENGNQYLASRDASGRWSAVNVEPPSSSQFDQPVFKGFSPDLSVGFVNSANPGLAAGAPGKGYPDLYAETLASGAFTPLVTTTPAHRTPREFGAPGNPKVNVNAEELSYAGSSADLGHELFLANDTLVAGAQDGGEKENNLYDSSGGATTLVNVLPDGSSEPNATFGGPQLAIDGSSGNGNKAFNWPMFAHDISEDGSRIFWTDLNSGDLYVRENDTAPQSPIAEGRCTIPADACTVLIADKAQYWNATPDGSKVLYTKGGNLYEDNLETGQAIDLAPGGKVRGVAGASSDLSVIYFVAEAALAPGAEPQSCIEGYSGLCNLYALRLGEPARFIAALSGGDNSAGPESFNRFSGDWQGSLGDTEAEATPDGAHLLFTSKAHLTGYESGEAGQVFLYDFASGALHCLSCKPSGESSTGVWAAYLPNSDVGTTLPRWITDDGSRVFFDTLDGLVPQDTNNKTDVYEWERDGAGSCSDGPGCLYLISDGTSLEGTYLIGSSTSGDDVFITTRGRLVPEDENENVDVYDVRVGATVPPTPLRCTGTGCQGVPASPPVFATPPSATYQGLGNLAPVAPSVKSSSKPLTRAQKLARALKACKAKANKKKRAACVAQAEKRYGAEKKKRKKPSSSRRQGNAKKSSGRGK